MTVLARELDGVAGLAQPVSLAGDRVVPVLSPLQSLFPEGGLRRGSLVAVSGSTSLTLALAAGASANGSWCGAVGLPSLGLVAAAELGIVLERFPLVATPQASGGWAWAVAALLDAFDVVLAWGPSGRSERATQSRRAGTSDVRRLAARARERGAVLVVAGDRVEGADVRLAMVSASWQGLGDGHGRLRARRVEVVAEGRGSAARERRVALWLPCPDGRLAPATESSERPSAFRSAG